MLIYPVSNSTSFKGGLNPEVARNQMRILLTQDIWSPKLKVKMPETQLEKEVLLEVLRNRLKLDRFTRLNNQKLQLRGTVHQAAKLVKEEPLHPELPKLLEEIDKAGNLETTFNTLDKNIALEAKKNEHALNYFKNLQEIEEEYSKRKLVKSSALERFWNQVRKNNINADEQYSTKELIDIVSETPINAASKAASRPLTKKQLLANIEKQYEQILRETIDVYEFRANRYDDAVNARKLIQETYGKALSNIPGAEKQLQKIYLAVEKKITHKVDRLADTDIYTIGDIWPQMREVENSMRKTLSEVSELKAKRNAEPNNKELQDALKQKEEFLEELRNDWIKGMNISIKYENMNRQSMIDAGRISEYDYLTGENKTIKRHKAAFEVYQNNNESIPEDYWSKILA